jgi:hypothetical protein
MKRADVLMRDYYGRKFFRQTTFKEGTSIRKDSTSLSGGRFDPPVFFLLKYKEMASNKSRTLSELLKSYLERQE